MLFKGSLEQSVLIVATLVMFLIVVISYMGIRLVGRKGNGTLTGHHSRSLLLLQLPLLFKNLLTMSLAWTILLGN